MNEAKERRIAEQIQDALTQHLKLERSRVTPEALLREDLSLDSVDTVELLFHVEDIFNIQIPEEDLQKFRSVGDVIRYVEAAVLSASERPAHGRKEPRQEKDLKAKRKKK